MPRRLGKPDAGRTGEVKALLDNLREKAAKRTGTTAAVRPGFRTTASERVIHIHNPGDVASNDRTARPRTRAPSSRPFQVRVFRLPLAID